MRSRSRGTDGSSSWDQSPRPSLSTLSIKRNGVKNKNHEGVSTKPIHVNLVLHNFGRRSFRKVEHEKEKNIKRDAAKKIKVYRHTQEALDKAKKKAIEARAKEDADKQEKLRKDTAEAAAKANKER
jgi:hypothetical protein